MPFGPVTRRRFAEESRATMRPSHTLLMILALSPFFATAPAAQAAHTLAVAPKAQGQLAAVRAPKSSPEPHAPKAASLAPPVQTVALSAVAVKARKAKGLQSTAIGAYGSAPIHDTPAAITVIGRKELDDQQVRTLSDLARDDASLGDDYAPVGYYQDISIRGYPLDPATGFRINDLTIAGEQIVALEDKQQVEVLKGLAGIDAGVMEPGGVVNYVSKRPADVHTLTLGTDSHGSQYGAVDWGDWFTPDFGVRINYAQERINSYVEHANGHRTLTSIAVDWNLSPRASLELDADYQSNDQRSVSGYQLLGGTTAPGDADPTRMLGFEPWQLPVTIYSGNGSARFRYGFDDGWHAELAAGHSRSLIDDNVAFAYGCYRDPLCTGQIQAFFSPAGNYDVWEYRSPDETRSDDELRAVLAGHVGEGWLSQDLTFGMSDFHRSVKLRNAVFVDVGMANIADVNPPFFPLSSDTPGSPMPRFNSWQRTVFALDCVHLGQAWQLLAGGHFASLDEDSWNSDGTLANAARPRQWLPETALMWQPGAALTTYLSYSEGLSLGEQAPYWTSNSGDTLAPRLSQQIEAGVKFSWNAALNLAGALYRIHQPYQFAEPDASQLGFTFVERGEEVHTGIELSADGEVSRNLELHASVSLIQARAENTGVPVYEGHQVENVPRLRSSVYLDYRLPWAPQWSILGAWRHASENPASPEGQVNVPAYNVFDAGLVYRNRWGGHDLTWRLSVDNIFNRFYWRDTGSSEGDDYLFPGAPRLARLSVSVDL